MADLAVSLADRIFDHARHAAITAAETLFPTGVPREQILVLAAESARTFFATAVGDVASDMAMYRGAFLWAYAERHRALAAAPTANMHQHFIA